GLLALDEQLEDPWQQLAFDSRSLIPHLDQDVWAGNLRHEVDATALGRVAHGIIQEIGEHLRQTRRIAVDMYRVRRQYDVHRLFAFGAERSHGLERILDDVRDGDLAPLQSELVARDAADVQQVIGQSRQLLDLALKHALQPLQV